MIVNYFTKLLVGALLSRLRNTILNINKNELHIYAYEYDHYIKAKLEEENRIAPLCALKIKEQTYIYIYIYIYILYINTLSTTWDIMLTGCKNVLQICMSESAGEIHQKIK